MAEPRVDRELFAHGRLGGGRLVDRGRAGKPLIDGRLGERPLIDDRRAGRPLIDYLPAAGRLAPYAPEQQDLADRRRGVQPAAHYNRSTRRVDRHVADGTVDGLHERGQLGGQRRSEPRDRGGRLARSGPPGEVDAAAQQQRSRARVIATYRIRSSSSASRARRSPHSAS